MTSKLIARMTDAKFNRGYLQDGGFKSGDDVYRFCPFCNNGYVDELPDNRTINERNQKIIKDYKKRMEEYEKGLAVNAKTGKPLKSAPKLQAVHERIFRCHYRQFYCLHKHSDWGMTCPIKCRDDKGGRYPFDKKGHCTCPLCKCECNMCFKVSFFYYFFNLLKFNLPF